MVYVWLVTPSARQSSWRQCSQFACTLLLTCHPSDEPSPGPSLSQQSSRRPWGGGVRGVACLEQFQVQLSIVYIVCTIKGHLWSTSIYEGMCNCTLSFSPVGTGLYSWHAQCSTFDYSYLIRTLNPAWVLIRSTCTSVFCCTNSSDFEFVIPWSYLPESMHPQF